MKRPQSGTGAHPPSKIPKPKPVHQKQAPNQIQMNQAGF